jgi:hypothetical protein
MNNNLKIPVGKSNIEILKWIWGNLIPAEGQSIWVQGEVLRAIEKLRREAQANGNVNWDDRFEMFVDYIEKVFKSEKRLDGEIIKQIEVDLDRLKDFETLNNPDFDKEKLPYVNNDLYDRLCECLVAFCKLNPELIKRELESKQYR